MQHDVHTRSQCLICCPGTCSIAYRQAQGIGRTRAHILHRGRWLDRTQPVPLLWPQPTATLLPKKAGTNFIQMEKLKVNKCMNGHLLCFLQKVPFPYHILCAASCSSYSLKNPYTQQKKTTSTRNVCLKSYLILSREQQPFQGRYILYHLL